MSIMTKREDLKGIVKFDIFRWCPEIFSSAKARVKRTRISKDVFFHTLFVSTSRIKEDYVYEGR